MRGFFRVFIVPFLVLFLCPGWTSAYNITIADGNFKNPAGWYGQQEDEEVEPGMVSNQSWDLEGFFLRDTLLTMVGGYDFANGQSTYTSGDIFLSTAMPVYGAEAAALNLQYGNGNIAVENQNFGYDYAIDLDFSDPTKYTYTVYALTDTSMLRTGFYDQNEASTPWEYVSGGTVAGTGTFGYATGLSDAYAFGLAGGSHNAVTIDLANILDVDQGFWAHFTMECGNDSLMGHAAPVPEPATLLLLGTGLVGLAGVSRKKFSTA